MDAPLLTLSPFHYALCALWALSASGIAWYVTRVARQITYVTLADGRQQQRRLPVLMRIFLPLTQNVAPLFRKPAFERYAKSVQRRIVSAGFEELISSEQFLSLQVLLPGVMGTLWILFAWGSISASHSTFLGKLAPFIYIMGPLWLYAYPGMWLSRTLKQRHSSIRRALPFVLDLLTLSVEAGMDFMTGLQRNIERRKIDALGEELISVVRQIQLGKTRREALLGMSQRVNLTDLRLVVNALVQADELGVSIGSILRIQSDQMRQRRFERAEKLANEAPVKMLFPLMFFIFPAVFLILLGPILNRLLEQGF